jgi:acyl-coenzyme A synthetase/AMP-(fatty) acid ligase
MNWALERFRQFDQRLIAVHETGAVSYADFVRKIGHWIEALERWGVRPGDRVGLVSDHHIEAIALLQALVAHGCIVIPLSEDDSSLFDERLRTACATHVITAAAHGEIAADTAECRRLPFGDGELHPLLAPMAANGSPGFVIYTSGSTGKGKAVLLDAARMTRRYRERIGQSFRALMFLKLDHVAGLNSLFASIYNGGTIVTCRSRQAKDICACIEKYSVEAISTTPSFLTMLLMSGVHNEHDLSSLEIINYGTEVMPGSTLATLHRTFPGVALKQGYGLSELGVMPTKSKDSSSRWMKIGGYGCEVEVRDGTLWIKSEQAMLGYLNAPSPFDQDGWYNTGDKVEVDGEYFQILGRESEIINVAGEKVFPAEIESFLLTLDNVKDVVVRKKKSPVVGQMVWAEFLLDDAEEPASFRKRALEHCQRHLAPYKVPGHITIATTDNVVGSRFKKIRTS